MPPSTAIERVEKTVLKTTLSGGSRLIHLDMARGVAAFLVCAAHLRFYMFSDYGLVSSALKPQDKLFYFMTTLGHQAVTVFFVLSGYFVAGSVAKDFSRGTWSWLKYATQRLTRLYVVLIPALLLTLYWDKLSSLTHSNEFDPNHSFSAFMGSLLFLQTIYTPVYGTNGVLWSLAYEFWYYLMFPLAFVALANWRRPKAATLAHGLLFFVCLAILPWAVLKGFLIWLMGFGAYLLVSRPQCHAYVAKRGVFIAGSISLAAVLVLIKRPSDGINWQDALIGISFVMMLPWLALNPPTNHPYRILALLLSDISYTLYTVHFPVAQFFHFALVPSKSLLPSPTNYLGYLLHLTLVLLYAWLIWWLFEYRTPKVRQFLVKTWPILGGPPRRPTEKAV